MIAFLGFVFLLLPAVDGFAVSISPNAEMARASVVRTARKKKVAAVPQQVTSESEAESTQQAAIPPYLHFNWRVNFLEHEDVITLSLRENVKAIIKLHPGMNMSFHNDQQCFDALERVHSKELASWFVKEPQGCYKSDLCRLAVLYENGGYYFDNDFDPTVDVRKLISPGASVSSVLAMTSPGGLDSRYDVFQAFLAASPKHPAIKYAMDATLDWYQSGHSMDHRGTQRMMLWKHPARDGPCDRFHQGTCHMLLPGPVFVGSGIRQWLSVSEFHVGQMDQGSCNVGDKCAYFFQETADLKLLGLQERSSETGWPRCAKEPFHSWCNIAVKDSTLQPMGWSRSPEAAEFEGYHNTTSQLSLYSTAVHELESSRNAHLMTHDPGL